MMQIKMPIHKELGRARTATGMRVLVFTSGKGGVGKTNLAANTAIALSRLNQRVILFDADLGLANVDVLFGLKPRYTLRHVIHGRKSIRDIIMTGPEGVPIITGGSGIRELANLTPDERIRCIDNFAELEDEYDIILVDTSAGISPNVLSFLFRADEIVLVTTPEPTAFTDAYALIKIVSMAEANPCIRLLVNMTSCIEEALSTAQKIQLVSANFLNLKVDYLGHIPYDKAVSASVKAQTPFLIWSPESPASKAVSMLARRICNGAEIDTEFATGNCRAVR